MKNLPPHLQAHTEKARAARATPVAARRCLVHLDLTSLNDTDTPATTAALLARADQGDLGRVAALCVYPGFLAQAFNALSGTGIGLATVVNFPEGTGTPESTARDVRAALALGANEIDIVLDHTAFRKGDETGPAKLLAACREACGPGVTMKVILETAEFDDYATLARAARLALAQGADFLKTSTGKSPKGGATLEAAAVLLEALDATDKGLKISGGVKTVEDAARYMALVSTLRGPGWIRPQTFRIGASSVMDDILQILGRPAATPAPPQAY